MTIWDDLGTVAHTIEYREIDGWRTRVLRAGSGPALVLMHGTGGHLEAFSRNIPALSEHFTVIAYDFPGQGYTTQTDRDLEIDAYVGHLAALLDDLDLDRVHLSGESLGGWVAIKFAVKHPGRLDRVVLNTPGGTMAAPEVMARIRDLSQAAADDPSEERIRARLEWLMADPSSVTDELVGCRRAIYSQPGFAESMRHVLCLQDPQVRRRNMVTDADLAAVTAPALVIWTSDDPSGPAGAGMDMADKMPNGRFLFIDGAGHWPQWEQQEICDKAVIGFLAGDV
ncbi:alpha/beta fold hydrolase [Rhodococcus sp. F64268]|uniref:alpha/beta fold hydrolase n=1 Tax=Rhodococcus sp. F64268 TaxID=2926402 RepID=UPI001FF4A897|nr:alpha/beta hydrolase [Rhodococcus sp. F64268]MCK0090544.1 alpha/beta fold hydrolase [Rhodococcus sp. F64268]